MINQRYKTTTSYRNASLTLCHLSVAVLLSACGSGGGQSDEQEQRATATGSISTSAAQLAEDGTTTLSLAQASAAGLIPLSSVETSTETDLLVGSGVPEVGAASAAPTSTTPSIDSDSDVITTATPTTNEPEQESVTTDAVVETQPDNEVASSASAESEALPDNQEPITAATESESLPENEESSDAVATTGDTSNSAETDSTPTDSTTPEQAEANEATAAELNTGAKFTATNTDGFVGEVLEDGVVKVNWVKDPTARGYNVYRQAEYIKTVFEEEYIDTDTFDESYYYEIQAFDFDENYNYVAVGLTVEVEGTGRINPDSPKPKEDILDGYELVFADEFNGTELDSSKWVTQYLWGDELIINSEEQHYVDILNKPDFGFNPFTFDGESVTINSIETPNNLMDKANGQKYLSGVMTSYDAFKFTYGYVEARAQMPFGKGLWPAFWLLNAYYVDDKPEIDIMEFIGDNQDVVYHTYHYYDSNGELRSTHSEPTVGVDWTNGWHTYAVEWLPGTLIFYVDGIEAHRVVDAKVSQQDMYIIANTALGGWWPGSPDSTTQFPAQYKIDYIRAYQKTGTLQSDPTEGLASDLPLWDDVPNASPSHLPPFEVFPEGYPERQVR